jgi:radical SAM protein with 4Fe4S-binding SPASM domain
MRVNLITNGTHVTPKLARMLADHGLDSAQVSLEGVTAATHDALVGMRGAYQQSIAAVKHLKDAGIHTHTNTTMTHANLRECVEFPRFVRETLHNDKFSMNLIIPAGNGAISEGLLVHYHKVGSYLKEILAASQREGVEFMWYSPVPLCFFNSITHGLGNKGCSACDGLLSVGANGDVLPCASFDAPVGNLVKQDFLPIWQSESVRMYRQKALAHPQCQTCEHFAVCHGACPLYWRHVGFGELWNDYEH